MVQRNLLLIIILFSSCFTVFSQQKEKKINFTILDASFDIGDPIKHILILYWDIIVSTSQK
jgi:hypothetical protein